MVKPVLSGLQKDVINLYRSCIRASYKKGPARQEFIDYARQEFHKFRGLSRKDFTTIEYLLRRGNRQLETYSSPNLTRVH